MSSFNASSNPYARICNTGKKFPTLDRMRIPVRPMKVKTLCQAEVSVREQTESWPFVTLYDSSPNSISHRSLLHRVALGEGEVVYCT